MKPHPIVEYRAGHSDHDARTFTLRLLRYLAADVTDDPEDEAAMDRLRAALAACDEVWP